MVTTKWLCHRKIRCGGGLSVVLSPSIHLIQNIYLCETNLHIIACWATTVWSDDNVECLTMMMMAMTMLLNKPTQSISYPRYWFCRAKVERGIEWENEKTKTQREKYLVYWLNLIAENEYNIHLFRLLLFIIKYAIHTNSIYWSVSHFENPDKRFWINTPTIYRCCCWLFERRSIVVIFNQIFRCAFLVR